MKTSIILLLLLVSTSCTNNETTFSESTADQTSENASTHENEKDFALHFINAYVKNCNLMANAKDILTWTDSTQATTALFRTELKKIIAEADPEYGLEADPIFNAQDYPDNGFETDTYDASKNMVTVKGKSMPELRVKIKLVKEDDELKIDGCGIINMSKR